jgi:cell division protein ZapA (FtsZ GTPase activity inhibitor)
MENSEKYEVELFGQKFVLYTTDGEKNELKKVVEYYKSIVENLSGKFPERQFLDIAILAGLKVTEKLYSIAGSKNIKIEPEDKKIHKIVNDAIKRLDNSLGL